MQSRAAESLPAVAGAAVSPPNVGRRVPARLFRFPATGERLVVGELVLLLTFPGRDLA